MRIARRVPLVIFLPAFAAAASAAAPVYDYEPAQVALRGEVRVERKAGPPNYGEGPHDAAVDVPVLHVWPAFDVRAAQDDPLNGEAERGVDAVQLVRGAYRGRLDGCMEVSGGLFRAQTAGHYTRVLLDVRDAHPAQGCGSGAGGAASGPATPAPPAQAPPAAASAPASAPAAPETAPRGVAALFLALPAAFVDYPPDERARLLDPAAGRLIANDPANGYLAIGGDGAAPGYALALFRRKGLPPVLAVQRYDEAGETTRFLVEEDGAWRDRSRDLVPGYAAGLHYELPRRGTTVAVTRADGSAAGALRLDGERFAPVR